MTTWITRWRHERARQAAQRTASANRAAAAIEEGKDAVGTYAAVAELLGISPQAVADARINAQKRGRPEPMADHVDVDLPRAGDAVPTAEEWAQVPARDRRDVAVRAAATWEAIDLVTGFLGRLCFEASEAMAETLLDEADGLDDLELAQRICEVISVRLTEQDALRWPRFTTREARNAGLDVLGDLGTALKAHAREADRQRQRWEWEAGELHEGEAGML